MARNRQRNRTDRSAAGTETAAPRTADAGSGEPPIVDEPLVAFDDDADDAAGKAFGAVAAEPHAPRRGLGARAVGFLRDSWAELQRVQWPDRQQVAQATGVVLGFVVLTGVFLGVADYVAGKIVNAII